MSVLRGLIEMKGSLGMSGVLSTCVGFGAFCPGFPGACLGLEQVEREP